MNNNWFSSQIFKGDQSGRTINFPTVNLDPQCIPQDLPQGVYASIINYNNVLFKGSLYFGPRLVVGETKTVLEIHIFDFSEEIYGETISFQIKDFIRGVLDFASFGEMKSQLEKDVAEIKQIFTE